MNAYMNMKRRIFIQFAGMGALMTLLPPRLLAQYEGHPVVPHDLGDPGCPPTSDFRPDVEIELTARATEAAILPGRETQVWKYEGRVLHGPQSCVKHLPGSYLGAMIHLEKSQKVRIHFRNQLPEDCITHWHGVMCPSPWTAIPYC